MSTPNRIPEDLKSAGSELYKSLTEGRTTTAAHRSLILQAARMADRLDALTDEVGDRLTTTNSQGTETINPLISEHRMISTAMAQIMKALGVQALPEKADGALSLQEQLKKAREEREAREKSA